MSTSPFSMALSSEAKMLNPVPQGRLPFAGAVRWLESFAGPDQQPGLKTIVLMCHQAHPQQGEIDRAITLAELKPTFTLCVMLHAAAQPEHALDRIAALPTDERQKAF